MKVKKQQGGARIGTGPKKKAPEDKKRQVGFSISEKKITKYGGLDGLKPKVYRLIEDNL